VAEFVSAILYHFNREGRDSFTPRILNPKHQTSNKIKEKFNSFQLNTNSQKRLGFLNFGICICLELVFWDLEFIQWGLPRLQHVTLTLVLSHQGRGNSARNDTPLFVIARHDSAEAISWRIPRLD
jgi:hypothetical protein